MEHVLRTCLKCDRRPSVFLTVAFGMMMLVAIGLVVLIAWATWRSLFAPGASAWPAVLERGCGDDWRLVRLWRWLKIHCGDFLTSSCFLSVWHSLAVLVRFSSVEDVKYPGPFAWMMRIYGLVTFDLAAWLPTPCVQWSYYHTLLVVTLAPVVCIALAAVCHPRPPMHGALSQRSGWVEAADGASAPTSAPTSVPTLVPTWCPP